MGIFTILAISILFIIIICPYIQNRFSQNMFQHKKIKYTINDDLFDKLPLNFIVITPDGVITRVDKLLLPELNLKHDDVVNKDIRDTIEIIHDKENVFPECIEMLNGEKNVITFDTNIFTCEPQKHIMNITMSKTWIFPWSYDMDRNIMVIDLRYFDYLGLQTKDYTLTMQQFEELVHLDGWKVLSEALEKQENGNLYENPISFRIHGEDGTWEWLEGQSTYVGQFTDLPFHLIGICMSIQRHKDNENILNEALIKAQRSDELIEKNVHLLMMLISDILDLSKIESNTMEFNYCDVSLTMLLNDIISAQRINIKSGMELKTELPSQNILIRTDPCRLGQVLNNLINNANKFTGKGYVRVGCRCDRLEIIESFVENAGRGMFQTLPLSA